MKMSVAVRQYSACGQPGTLCKTTGTSGLTPRYRTEHRNYRDPVLL